MPFLSALPSTTETQAQVFNLGSVLSVIGLFFAVLGLVNPRLELQLKLRPWWGKSILIAFFTGCVVALAGSFVEPIQHFFGIKTKSPMIEVLLMPNTLELIGGAIVIVSIGLFVWLWLTKLPPFGRRNHMIYIKTVLLAIAAHKNLSTLLEELVSVADSIVCEAVKYKEPRDDRGDEAQTMQNEISYSALATIDALSDQDVTNLMVTNCPRVGMVLLTLLKKYKCAEKNIGHSFVEALSRASLLNPNSVLSRERDFEGLGFFKNFTKTLYGDEYFVNGYDTLGAWRSYERGHVNRSTVENYCKALREALALKDMSPQQVKKGIERLSSPIPKITKGIEEKNWRYDCEEGEMLDQIVH